MKQQRIIPISPTFSGEFRRRLLHASVYQSIFPSSPLSAKSPSRRVPGVPPAHTPFLHRLYSQFSPKSENCTAASSPFLPLRRRRLLSSPVLSPWSRSETVAVQPATMEFSAPRRRRFIAEQPLLGLCCLRRALLSRGVTRLPSWPRRRCPLSRTGSHCPCRLPGQPPRCSGAEAPHRLSMAAPFGPTSRSRS